jgi:PKD repeat protein
MRVGIIIFLLCVIHLNLWAQCPVTDFVSPATACINQNLTFENTTTGASSFEWDFCSGDLDLTPNSSIAASNNFLFRTRAIRVVKNSGNWYGFTIDQANSPYRLIRFNFGTSLLNNPSITDLGNPSGLLNSAYDFQMYSEAGNWYALVANSGANNILKFSFGLNLDSNPSVQNLGSFGVLDTPNGITIINNNGSISVFVTNGGTSKIVRLDFGASIDNTPTVASFSVSGGSTLRGISLIQECDRWFGLVSSFGNGKVFWLDFSNGLSQDPSSGEITFFTSYNFPASISILSDGGDYFAFIQSAVGPLYKLSFGTSIIDKSGTGQSLGNFGITENSATEWVVENSEWVGFSIDLANRKLIRYTFPTACDATPAIHSGEAPPIIQYSTSGTKKISLVTKSSDGAVDMISKNTTISSAISPDINFTSQNICANHDVNFTSQNISGDIILYDWSFGDVNTSSASSPIHQYIAAGDYAIQLEVTSANGCTNFISDSLKIYDQPTATFTAPAGTICTNDELMFTNTTIDSFGGNLSYQWLVNNQPVGTDRDLLYEFTISGNNDVTMQAIIPGCSDEVTENFASVIEGPVSDFFYAGHCEDDDVVFTNNSSGSISGYSWDFDDSQSSTETNPQHSFSTIGVYDITLTASSASGCNNARTKTVTIYSKPQTNFYALQPPFSCNGTPTEFRDLTPNPTDSNLATWQWNFGDTGSSQNTSSSKNPQHTFNTAGDYTVSLTVSTNFLCSTSLQLPITISQAPVADFNYSTPCEDSLVYFSDASTGSVESWVWQIGSSIYSSQNPTHTFSNSGSANATLTVTATNDCIASISNPIIVPTKLAPDFSVSKNCINQQTLFTDITNDATDPITDYQWNVIGGGASSGSPVEFTFASVGTKNIKLTVTTQSGCDYSIIKPVSIINSPSAGFTASPETGGPPLTVHFTNTSTNATSYLWTFNDGNNTMSTQVSPLFTYQELGQYETELTAFNTQNCSNTTSKLIDVVTPVIDVAINGLELMEFQNGSLKPAVTVFNHSNVPISNLALLLDVSGPVIREYLNNTIQPNSSYRHVFQFEFPETNSLNYFCIEVEIDDVSLNDNTTCLGLEQSFIIIAPHPNPGKGVLNINWILNEDGVVNIALLNSMGQSLKSFQVSAQEGLTPFSINTTGLDMGVYFVRINYRHTTKVYRVLISE